MPLPEIIDRLFEARYEYEMTRFSEKAQAEERYKAILLEASAQYSCHPDELRYARWLVPYYRDWRTQNKLPKPPKM